MDRITLLRRLTSQPCRRVRVQRVLIAVIERDLAHALHSGNLERSERLLHELVEADTRLWIIEATSDVPARLAS